MLYVPFNIWDVTRWACAIISIDRTVIPHVLVYVREVA
jgi:hypothetical protein